MQFSALESIESFVHVREEIPTCDDHQEEARQ